MLQQAQSGLDRLNNVVYNLRDMLNKLPETAEQSAADKRNWRLWLFTGSAIEAMDDDFNTADALAVLLSCPETNSYLSQAAPDRLVVEKTLALFEEVGDILGFFADKEDSVLDSTINELIERRQAARQAKDWAAADAIRDQLSEMGIILEDTPQGVRWRKK